MSVLRFLDDIIGHLAWPVVVLIGIFVFREVLRNKLGDMTEADVSVGKWHVALGFRRKLKSQLEYVGADLTQSQDESTIASHSHAPADSRQTSIASVEKITTPDTTKEPVVNHDMQAESADESKHWASIRTSLARNPHFAIHLAGLQIDAALNAIAGPEAPALGMLVRPKYLADQGLISQELADASFRLLQVRNTVEGSPKFMLPQEIAEDFVSKAHELVAALDCLPRP